MRSLIRNDLRWAWPLALVGTLFQLIAEALEYRVAPIWILPVQSWPNISLIVHAVGAPIVGLWALAADDVLGTREYRMHRPQSPGRLFWTRHLVGLAVVATWVLLVPTLHLGGAALFSPDAALLDAGRWWYYVAQGIPAFAFYALGVFLGSCAQSVIGGLFAAAAGVSVALLAALGAFFFGPPSASVWVVGATLATAPGLLILAEQNTRQARDRDRPWSDRRLARAGTGLLLVGMLVASAALSLWQVGTREALLHTYPDVAAVEGQPALERSSDERVDREHRPLGRFPGHTTVLFAPSSDRWAGPRPATFRHPVFPYYFQRFRGLAFRRLPYVSVRPGLLTYAGEDGYLHVFQLSRAGGATRMQPRALRVGKGPEGRPFSAGTRVLDALDRTPLLADPTDGIWIYDLERQPAGFSPVPLPGGDRFVGLVDGQAPDPESAGALARAAVRGERGTYVWVNGRFEPGSVPPDPGARPTPQVTLHGPVALSVSLPLPGGSSFEHAYRPRTFQERTLALLHRGSALLRPPLLAPLALLAATDRGFEIGPAILLDRPLLFGDRAALAGNLLLSLLLAALAHRRLRRLGVPRGRRLYWATAIVLGGSVVFLCQRWIERARAWQPLPAEPEGRPAPGPLLPAPRPAGAA